MRQDPQFETIAAISTPIGEGGIGIIRISGALAKKIGEKLSDLKLEDRKVYFAAIKDLKTNEVIDEGIVLFMGSPNSYTGEDVVEIQIHSGVAILNKLLDNVYSLGAKPAKRGEFTKRAFLNGKLDLIKAESVLDIIEAETDEALNISQTAYSGKLQEKIKDIKAILLNVISPIEGSIDFPQDIEGYDKKTSLEKLKNVDLEISKLLSSYKTGKILKDGIKTVIVGKPNVGKSTLMNTLLKYPRVLVSHIPGTTRDIVSETINFDGIKMQIFDTAGLRKTEDFLEILSQEKTYESLKESEIVLFVMDSTEEIQEEDEKIFKLIKDKPHIIVLNKIDIGTKTTVENLKKFFLKKEIVQISATLQTGIDELKEHIKKILIPQKKKADEIYLYKERHKRYLELSKEDILKAISMIEENVEDDLIVFELKEALENLNIILGVSYSDEILDEIFSRFCIGK